MLSTGPTGTITFADSGIPIGTGTIENNSATISTNALAAGSHKITATWSGNSSSASVTSSAVIQTVNAVAPTLMWPAPSAITYGIPLTSTQLDASSGHVAGVFSYSPATGTILTAGPQTLSATFTPTDSTDYTTETVTTHLTVEKATPLVTWPTPPSITYGSALSASELDASSSVPGTFVYSPAPGAILNVGAQTLTATFTPSDTADYNSVTATATQLVTQPTLAIISPATTLLPGSSYSFTATENGSIIEAVQWAVNGIVGGKSQVGTITTAGVYTAPNTSGLAVIITASLQADPTAQASMELQVIGPVSAPGTIGFAFTLPTSASTSAGVYDASGNLIRTLWSNQSYPAGLQTGTWDGNNDAGVPMPAGLYQIRVLHNNVQYTWGVIGNTSSSWVSPNSWDKQDLLPQDMAVIGDTAYVANGYAEGRPNASSFALSTPQQPQSLFTIDQCTFLQYMATDGNLLYFVNTGDGWSGSVAYVMAFNPTSNQFYAFPAGAPLVNPCSYNGPASVLDYIPPSGQTSTGANRVNIATGIAVQTNGNLLAVSHGASNNGNSILPSQDLIRLFNKMSGAPVGTINIANPQRLAFEPDGTLWVISGTSVVQITSVGNSNTIGTKLSGLSQPLAIAVDPSTGNVLVTDGGTSQQVKQFSESGQLLAAYGDAGGFTDCNPTVSNSRLFLDSTAGVGYAQGTGFGTAPFVSVLPDRSFWFGDPGNARSLHISAEGEYMERIAFLRFLYNIAADHGNPTRVFADTLEYSINYTEPLVPGDPESGAGGNGSWTLVRNWSACLPSNYSRSFLQVQTMSNGHTYASIANLSLANYYGELAELPASGPVRLSGQSLDYSSQGLYSASITHEGNLAYWVPSSIAGVQSQVAYQQNLAGFDDNDWPVWGAPSVIASVPNVETTDPDGSNGWGMGFWPEPTSGGALVTYNTSPATPGEDYHIGGVLLGGATWSWKASPGKLITTPDGKGTFPDTPGFGGHNGIAALVEGSNVFEGYDGQYGAFSSQWMHWSQDGLLIGQFGHPSDGTAADGSLFPGAAGNIATMSTVSANGNIYLYNSDESYHPGIHQWEVSGLDSIHELTGTTQLGGTVALQ